MESDFRRVFSSCRVLLCDCKVYCAEQVLKLRPGEILLESMDSKLQLVLEGYSVLANQIKDTKQDLLERADLSDFKIQVLNDKIDGIATDLQVHRTNTEAHNNKELYVVREG